MIDSYKGYSITITRGYITDKLTARNGNGDLHTRRFAKGDSAEDALELLKKDIDRYGQ